MSPRTWNRLFLGACAALLVCALWAAYYEVHRHDWRWDSRPPVLEGLTLGDVELIGVGFDADGSAVYDSPAGRVVLAPQMLAPRAGAAREALGRSLERAAGAGLLAPEHRPWRWRASPVTGGHLDACDDQVLVLPGAVLRQEPPPVRDTHTERRAVQTAAERLTRAASDTPAISPWMAGALGDVLAHLCDEAGNPALAELDAEFARRVVSKPGWLAAVAPAADARARAAVEEALAASRRLTPAWIYRGDGHAFARIDDAWGTRGVLLTGPERAVYLRVPPHPMDDADRMEVLKACRVAVVLPGGSDPLTDPASVGRFTQARLMRGEEVLAAWSEAGGFRTYEGRWRKHFPAPKESYLRDAWPPHVPIAGPDGRLHGVAVQGGVLRPVADESDAEAERFLADAARLLPDAARLDLLQQYFLRYVSDSPDLTQPLMIGCEAFHDEIHQTADQILDTCASGVCRGDCDDVAEFIHAIATRQGRLAHVVSLPGHLAAVWGEQEADGWRVYVMQSGPSHEYRHAQLPKALEAAYLDLDPNAPLDLNGLSVSIRFEGQNTRDVFRLSWRIFQDAEYARTMTDVQADWNRMTLLRAEQKMLRVIAAGDDSNANYSELAGLCSWTAQVEKAVRYDLETLKRRTEPESRLLLSTELAGHHLEAGQKAQAEALVADILDRQLPALAPVLGLRTLVIAVGLAGSIQDDAPLLATRVLVRAAGMQIELLGGSLAGLLQERHEPKTWREHDQNEGMQSVLEDYAGSALAILQTLAGKPEKGHPDVMRMLEPLAVWLREHVFDDVTDPDEIAGWWAYLARLSGAITGADMLPAIARAPLPKTARGVDHAQLAQTAGKDVVLSWANASPRYACNRLSELMADEEHRPDPAVVRGIARLLESSEDTAKRLGLFGPDTESAVRKARIRIALLTKDEAGLRRWLREVKALGDRWVFEDISRALGWAAVHLDLPWWRTAFQCWVDEVDNRVNYFNVVWRAVGVGALPQALHVADVAAKRYPDDAAIQEETRLLRRHLGAK